MTQRKYFIGFQDLRHSFYFLPRPRAYPFRRGWLRQASYHARQGPLNIGEAFGEFPEGGPERRLGIRAGKTAKVHQSEQKVAGLFLHRCLISRFQGHPELGELFFDLFQHFCGIAPVEPDRGGTGGDPLRPGQRGEGSGEAVAEAGLPFSLMFQLPF